VKVVVSASWLHMLLKCGSVSTAQELLSVTEEDFLTQIFLMFYGIVTTFITVS